MHLKFLKIILKVLVYCPVIHHITFIIQLLSARMEIVQLWLTGLMQ